MWKILGTIKSRILQIDSEWNFLKIGFNEPNLKIISFFSLFGVIKSRFSVVFNYKVNLTWPKKMHMMSKF